MVLVSPAQGSALDLLLQASVQMNLVELVRRSQNWASEKAWNLQVVRTV